MKALTLIGSILIVLGLAGVIWGLVAKYDDRAEVKLGSDVNIVLSEGKFPPIGIAGAIVAGVGVVMTVVGAAGSRRQAS
jgi:hypothetical protein